MAHKPDSNVWDRIAVRGGYYRRDPKTNIQDPKLSDQEILENKRKSSTTEKIVAGAIDTPVAIANYVTEVGGKSANYVSENVRDAAGRIARKAEETPYINKIDDGIKSLGGGLDALAKGQIPGGDAFANFLGDGASRISRIKDAPWLGNIMSLPSIGLYGIKKHPLLNKLITPEHWKEIDDVTSTLFEGLLNEMAEILVEWYKDPKTLCCLIKNLAALGSTVRAGEFENLEEFKESWDQQRQDFYAGVQVNDQGYLQSKEILKKIIIYIDMIIEILSIEIKPKANLFLDFGKVISDMIIGLLIGILKAIQTKGELELQEWIEKQFTDLEQLDLQCTPFQKLMNALIRFLSSDHGLFALLARYIRDYFRKIRYQSQKTKENYINKSRDLQFLRFLRDLIQKILDALENLELCIEDDFTMVETTPNPLSNFTEREDECPYGINANTTDNFVNCPYRTMTNNDIPCRVNDRLPSNLGQFSTNQTSYCLHPDAINNYFSPQNFNDTGNIGNIKGDYPGIGKKLRGTGEPGRRLGEPAVGDREQIAVTFPTDNEVRNFMVNRLGYSPDQADQMVAQSKVASNEGKIDNINFSNLGSPTGSAENLDKRQELMNALGDCAKTLSPQKIADLANRVTDIL